MPLVFAAAAVHAPGITGRPQNATEQQRAVFFPAYQRLREQLEAARLDALALLRKGNAAELVARARNAFLRAWLIGFGLGFVAGVL
ncbi:MAG: hypothetical protein ACREVR_14330, partial [Burkholderiales bacterium]